MKKLSLVAIVSLLLVGLAAPAFAQDGSGRSNDSYNREISLNYTFLRDVGENGTLGVMADFGKQLTSHASIVGEFAVTRFSYFEENYIQAVGGMRVGGVTGTRARPFAQIVVGLQREFGDNGLVFQPGGGVNFALGRRMDLKAQVDFPVLRWEGETYKQFRFSVGIGLPLGGN
jgi:hypothetical protein